LGSLGPVVAGQDIPVGDSQEFVIKLIDAAKLDGPAIRIHAAELEQLPFAAGSQRKRSTKQGNVLSIDRVPGRQVRAPNRPNWSVAGRYPAPNPILLQYGTSRVGPLLVL
jgi:hypothetical protein